MNVRLNIIAFIKEAKLPDSKYANGYVFYTGLAEQDIPRYTVFTSLQDANEQENILEGVFELELITVMSKNSEIIPQGYNAVIVVSSPISLKQIKEKIEFDDKGNLRNLCILATH